MTAQKKWQNFNFSTENKMTTHVKRESKFLG
jgi:hypothetical protein